MQNALMSKFIQKNRRTDVPEFRPGDTIRVHVKIKEVIVAVPRVDPSTAQSYPYTLLAAQLIVSSIQFQHRYFAH